MGAGKRGYFGASQVALVVKNMPANVRDIRDVGLIAGSGRSPGGRHPTRVFGILASEHISFLKNARLPKD